MVLPDYQGGSIVNLMASITVALGGEPLPYPPLRELPPEALGAGSLVLLVIDGLGHGYLERSGSHSVLRRHLEARITSVFPSTTATAITTFMTGLAPQQHALTGWHMYFRELEDVVAVLPFTPRGGGIPLRQRGQEPVALFGHAPLFDRLAAACCVVSPQRIVDSEFNVAHCGSATRVGYGSLAQFFAAIEAALREPGRRYVYAYYPEIDALAHVHGVESRVVAAHFAELDHALGRFLASIAGSGAVVLVTADHGFIDAEPGAVIELNDHPALAETLALPLCGERRVAYCYTRRERREQFESYVRTVLAEHVELFPSAELVARGWFGPGDPHPRLMERVGDYVLVMKHNRVIKDWLPGETRHVHIGVHGGVSEDEMYVPLVVARA